VPDVTVPRRHSAPELRAHLAVPPVGTGPWPGVVVLHELFGLTVDTGSRPTGWPPPATSPSRRTCTAPAGACAACARPSAR
jgi:dienelactone hydrolase